MERLRLARDIMVTKLVTVSPETDIFVGIRTLLRNGITGAPVIARDRTFLGMLSEKSCMRVLTTTAGAARDAEPSARIPARDFMARGLYTLSPDADCFEAIAELLTRRFSGAPVVDGDGNFAGIFSERYSMKLLVHSAWDQLPYGNVASIMNRDRGRLISQDTDLLDVAAIFLDSYYRRLPVLDGDKLVGQVSRRDVLRAEHHLAHQFQGVDGASPSHHALSATRVGDFMETVCPTIEEDTDFIVIAQTFLDSNRRRLPVLRDGRIVGQISRRDLLASVLESLALERAPEQRGLYLSAVADRDETPILEGPHHRTASSTGRPHTSSHPHHDRAARR